MAFRNDGLEQEGFTEAIKELLAESNTLFDDMIKKLNDFGELKKTLYSILFNGEKFPYNPDVYAINIGLISGLIKMSRERLLYRTVFLRQGCTIFLCRKRS